MEKCLFCEIQRGARPPKGGVLYEDELVYAHHGDFDEGPTYLGHVMVETKRHTAEFADLRCDEARAVGLLIARMSRALKASTGAERVYATYYGEVTPHLHVHLTARYAGTPAEYLRWNVEDWPDAPRGNADEVIALCDRLRAALGVAEG